MGTLKSSDWNFLETLSELSYCNQFLPERVELESKALGNDFDEWEPVWSKDYELDGERVNVQRLNARAEELAPRVRDEFATGRDCDESKLRLYEDLVQYVLYYRFRDQIKEIVDEPSSHAGKRVRCWKRFCHDFNHFHNLSGRYLSDESDPAHLFAEPFQIRRAFHHIYHFIVGRSMPSARLRAAVWQSIFTHDMRRYRRTLYDRMGDFTTLIAGPSGTGKELVARAIGMSRYVPFDAEKEQFTENFADSFYALNLSAMSPTLIESELFGHCKGAFTGAHSDRQGWLEICSSLGTVFLDEIGELDPAIQVKLLRVLQSRGFQRLGESTDRQFHGKIMAATNRDLAAEMDAGRFRRDFYYRLCSDIITTPTLRDQLADSPDDLHKLIQHIAARIVGDEGEAVAGEVEHWINQNLGTDYDWPGNIRELEQCVRNVMVRNDYAPPNCSPVGMDGDQLGGALSDCSLSADELIRRYCTIAYAKHGSYEKTAKQLGLDRRTVKAKIDPGLLDEMDE